MRDPRRVGPIATAVVLASELVLEGKSFQSELARVIQAPPPAEAPALTRNAPALISVSPSSADEAGAEPALYGKAALSSASTTVAMLYSSTFTIAPR